MRLYASLVICSPSRGDEVVIHDRDLVPPQRRRARRHIRARLSGRASCALFAIVLLASVCSGTSSSSTSRSSTELRGARLRVLAVWTGAEARRFAAVIRAFEAHTGVVIDYVSTGDRIADELAARRAAHDLPDVAFVPQPGLLRQYARDGLLVPLGAGTVNEVTRKLPSGMARARVRRRPLVRRVVQGREQVAYLV